MKILWLAPHPIPSDKNAHPAPWITSLANKIIASGHNLTIVSVHKKIQQPIEEFNNYSYKLIVVKAPSIYSEVLTLFTSRIIVLTNYLKKYGNSYDIVHIHGTEHQLATSYLRAKLKVPAVVSIQGLIFKYKKFIPDIISKRKFFWELSSYYEKIEIKNSNFFFCRTIWDVSSINELNNNPSIFLIWELLRPEFYSHITTLEASDILFFGGNNYLKGLSFALQVFDKLISMNIDSKLQIVGKCSLNDIEIICKKYKLKNLNSSHIVLHGLLDAKQIINVYDNCYCLYHPSLIDNSPNSICEAQLVGLPVIANKVGGVESLIEHGETGFLVELNNIEEHVSVLNNLKNDLSLRKSISIKSREVALARHNIESIVGDTLNAYNKILNVH